LNTYLESERVYLREFVLSDEDHLLNLDSDPEVMKYLTGGKATTRDSIQRMMTRVHSELKKHDGKFGVWAAIEKETESFMGWFHLFPPRDELDNTKKLFLGYRLQKKYWGLGYATEVSTKLIEKAFKDFNADEVFAQSMKANLDSQKVMTKIGMEFRSHFTEPTFPEGAQDAVLFSIKSDLVTSGLR
jgi:RimJ/RimL family protein N-acetyltransferase